MSRRCPHSVEIVPRAEHQCMHSIYSFLSSCSAPWHWTWLVASHSWGRQYYSSWRDDDVFWRMQKYSSRWFALTFSLPPTGSPTRKCLQQPTYQSNGTASNLIVCITFQALYKQSGKLSIVLLFLCSLLEFRAQERQGEASFVSCLYFVDFPVFLVTTLAVSPQSLIVCDCSYSYIHIVHGPRVFSKEKAITTGRVWTTAISRWHTAYCVIAIVWIIPFSIVVFLTLFIVSFS